MHLARVGPAGNETPVLLHNSRLFDLTSVTDDIHQGFFLEGGIERTALALKEGTLRQVEWDSDLRFGPPISRPGAIICVGMNYAAHAAESGAEPPSEPVIFLKTPNTVSGPNDPILIPSSSARTDWEVELGVIMADFAFRLDSPEDAYSKIAGYSAVNDISEREFQIDRSGGQWSKGKCFPSFCPVGPWLVTADSISVDSLTMRSWVNGNLRQDSSTSDMIFDVGYLIWHLSHCLQLEPGDLVLTGTPEGVALSGRFPYLQPGDEVAVEIEGLGRQTQVCVETLS